MKIMLGNVAVSAERGQHGYLKEKVGWLILM